MNETSKPAEGSMEQGFDKIEKSIMNCVVVGLDDMVLSDLQELKNLFQDEIKKVRNKDMIEIVTLKSSIDQLNMLVEAKDIEIKKIIERKTNNH